MELISNSLTELVHDFQIQIFSELKMMSQSLVVKAFFFFFFAEVDETGLFHTGTSSLSFLFSAFFCFYFPPFSVMKLLNMGKGKQKRNNCLTQKRENSFHPGLLLKIDEPVTMILFLLLQLLM